MIKVTGFDGKIHKFNFSKYRDRKNRAGKSQYHIFARELIKETFPSLSVYEEVTLPGSKRSGGKSLYADFFIPSRMIIIEVHGEQHYEYCHLFHKTKMKFFESQKRDRDKIEWCEINNIQYIELKYNERDLWKSKICYLR